MQPTSLTVTSTAPRADARDAPAAPALTLAADTRSVRQAIQLERNMRLSWTHSGRNAALLACTLVVLPSSAAAVCHHVPAEFPSIAEAVESAAAGDTIEVAAGVYTGPLNRDIDPGGRDLVFLAPAGSNSTIIDCEHLGRAFEFHNGESRATVLQGFRIRDGGIYYSMNGGGARCFRSDPSFIECVFESCEAQGGAGVMAYEASPSFEKCSFLDNSAAWGGGISFYGGREAIVNRCVFRGNSGFGGGIDAECTSVTVSWCEFSGNRGSDAGSGIFIAGSFTTVVANCTFTGHLWWPAIECWWGNGACIQNCVLAFNNVRPMWCNESTPSVQFCISYGNSYSDDLCGDVTNSAQADPLFCDLEQLDVTLCADSPCLPENNPWNELIGARNRGCGPCATLAESSSWGQIKAMFR
jgi:hypothetical protein